MKSRPSARYEAKRTYAPHRQSKEPMRKIEVMAGVLEGVRTMVFKAVSANMLVVKWLDKMTAVSHRMTGRRRAYRSFSVWFHRKRC